MDSCFENHFRFYSLFSPLVLYLSFYFGLSAKQTLFLSCYSDVDISCCFFLLDSPCLSFDNLCFVLRERYCIDLSIYEVVRVDSGLAAFEDCNLYLKSLCFGLPFVSCLFVSVFNAPVFDEDFDLYRLVLDRYCDFFPNGPFPDLQSLRLFVGDDESEFDYSLLDCVDFNENLRDFVSARLVCGICSAYMDHFKRDLSSGDLFLATFGCDAALFRFAMLPCPS